MKKLLTSLKIFLLAQGFERIPLKKLTTGHYKISIAVNNMIGHFILDTGASTSCIGFENTTYFLLHSEDSDIKAAGAGTLDMETKISKKNSVQIGSKILTQKELILFDLSHVNEALQQTQEEAVHGILGADILKQLRTVIDYGRNCIYIK